MTTQSSYSSSGPYIERTLDLLLYPIVVSILDRKTALGIVQFSRVVQMILCGYLVMVVPTARALPTGPAGVDAGTRFSRGQSDGRNAQPRQLSIRLAGQNFALFSKVLVDLVLDRAGSIS